MTKGGRTTVVGARRPPRAATTNLNRLITPKADDGDWRNDASCTGNDPELWFADSLTDKARAIAICQGCPVMTKCLAWAIEARIPYGIWGALDFSDPIKPWTIRGQHPDAPPVDTFVERVEELHAAGASVQEIVATMCLASTQTLVDGLRRRRRKDVAKKVVPEYRPIEDRQAEARARRKK